jgi:lipoic acid synthetase
MPENPPRPPWLVQRVRADETFAKVTALVDGLALPTVCSSAHCPNLGECFGAGTATFLVLGGVCTRRCRFCAVPKGAPLPLDAAEPARVADAVAALGLRHAVITSVTRDDLADGGAGHFAACIAAVRERTPQTTVEVLTPDFAGDLAAARTVFAARPDVFNHNIETVPRLYATVRPLAEYARSLALLAAAALDAAALVKSGLMVGLGETPAEVLAVMDDLYAAGVRAITIGQYLRPSPEHLPVVEYITPEAFGEYEQAARDRGFEHVAAGPLVRSSYHAAAFVNGR